MMVSEVNGQAKAAVKIFDKLLNDSAAREFVDAG